MRFVQAIPKQLYILMEYRFEELLMLKTILNHMTFDYNGEDPEHVKAKEYLEDKLYPELNKVIEGVVDDVAGSNS